MRFKLLASVAGAAVFAGFVGTAQAADLTPAPTGVDWSGFYAGLHVGYGEAYMNGCVDCGETSVAQADDLDLNGVSAGLHAGYNMQSDQFVYGLEADVSFNGWKDQADTTSDDEWSEGKVDVLGSLRLRLGYAMDSTLVYVTGGAAIADAEFDSTRDNNHDHVNFNDIGGVIGGGVEHMLFDNVSIRAEGLYYIFDDKEDSSNFHEGDPGDDITLEDMFVVRAGITLHFNNM